MYTSVNTTSWRVAVYKHGIVLIGSWQHSNIVLYEHIVAESCIVYERTDLIVISSAGAMWPLLAFNQRQELIDLLILIDCEGCILTHNRQGTILQVNDRKK